MAVMGKTKRSLPENTALTAEQQDEFNEKVKNIKKNLKTEEKPGVVYLGHIPHGFYEDQMRDYFSQFGTVLRVKLSRSRKSGKSKGYAFVEFESETVAKIVSDTMNNYLMFNRLLKCQFIESASVHQDTFKGCDKTFKPQFHVKAREKHNKSQSKVQKKQAVRKSQRKLKKTMSKLAEKGIKYEFKQKKTRKS